MLRWQGGTDENVSPLSNQEKDQPSLASDMSRNGQILALVEMVTKTKTKAFALSDTSHLSQFLPGLVILSQVQLRYQAAFQPTQRGSFSRFFLMPFQRYSRLWSGAAISRDPAAICS